MLEFSGIAEFNPMQEKCLAGGIPEGNIVVSAPTASGKTLVAEIIALDCVLNKKRKAIYTCPLRALASEHYSEFRRKYSRLGVKAAIATGDFDSGASYLENYDVIFTTYEKLESLLRHNTHWLAEVGLVIVDEIHEIDSDRGPTIEILLMKLGKIAKPRILGLSATIPNAGEIAEWLGAKLVESDFRPVKLEEGVFLDGKLDFGSRTESVSGSSLEALVKDTLGMKKQCIVFCNTRKLSQSTSQKLAGISLSCLSENEKASLAKAAAKSLESLEVPTEQCKLLSSLISCGIAFHNAGLVSKQRKIVEDLFREGTLKVVTATPTLAAGINTPAFRVIITSLHRYSLDGMHEISVREYKQMAGRAGRPSFDSCGESIVLCKNDFQAESVFENFIKGELEPVVSRLGMEPVLRTHILSSIASGYAFDLQSLEEFFSKSFYAHQYRDLGKLNAKIRDVLCELEELEFVQPNDRGFQATKLGKRVSELYLDPLSAHSMIVALKYNENELTTPLSYLFMAANSSELMPYISVPKADEGEYWLELQGNSPNLLVSQQQLYSDYSVLQKYATARMLNDWISESKEEDLMKEYNVMPGILRGKLEIVDWLLYSALELCQLVGCQKHSKNLLFLRKRAKHGVKEELLPLIELRGIGRVRARKLFASGITRLADLKKTDVVDLERLLGKQVALGVKRQLKQVG